MKNVALIMIVSMTIMSCSNLPIASIGQQGNSNYGDTRNFYRIETPKFGNELGQGFQRAYGSKCFLVSAFHVFQDGNRSIAVDRSNNEIELDISKNYTYPTKHQDIDTRVFDISDSVKKCPEPSGTGAALSSLSMNEKLTLNISVNNGEVQAIPLKLYSLPGVANATHRFKVRVDDDSSKLRRGYSGGLITSQSGVAVGMLIEIDNDKSGQGNEDESNLGIVQSMGQIDNRLAAAVPPKKSDPSFCSENKVICIGGAVALLAGGIGAAAAGSSNGDSSDGRSVSIQVPLP